MTKYLLQWEVVRERLADDPKTIARGFQGLVSLVKQDLEAGKMKDWGAIPGDQRGYCTVEGNERDVLGLTLRYAPFVKFHVHPVVDVREISEFLKSVTD